MDIPTSGVNTWLTLNGLPLSFQPGSENEGADAAENTDNIFRITDSAPDGLHIRIDKEQLKTERYGRWYWTPRDFAGLYELEVTAPGFLPFTTKVRVHPGKLSSERFVSMLVDITQFATDLLFSLHSPAGVKASTHLRNKEQSALREFQLVQHIMSELGVIMSRIRNNPCRSLQSYAETRLIHEIRQFSSEAMPLPGPFVVLTKPKSVQYLPLTWTVQENLLSYDVNENRLLKRFIQYQIVTKIKNIQNNIDREMRLRLQSRSEKKRKGYDDDETPKIQALEEKREESLFWIKKCFDWVGEPFLSNIKVELAVDKASQFLLKNPDYSRFYRLYLQFQRELKLNLDVDDFISMLALRKMSELYEIWSIFQITSLIIDVLIGNGYMMASDNFFYEVEKDRFQFEIKKNISSIILSQGNKRIEIKYEPLYKKNIVSPTGVVSLYDDQLTPDMAMEIYQSNVLHDIIIFDAKYKYQPRAGEYYPKEKDISKMSWYREAIRYKAYDPRHSNRRPSKIVRSAYILYPGTQLQHIQEEPEIGALPIVPDMKASRWLEVEESVKDILWFSGLIQ